jgi:regulation of enolase protein 1 (concanavalin A-like superfamily)
VEFNGDDWALIEAIAKLSTGHTVCTAVRCASPLPAAVSVIAVDMSLARPIHSKTDAKENQ